MRLSKLYPIIWKEIKDMLRDYRTLVVIAVMPIIMMPLMSLASIYVPGLQMVVVCLVDEDNSMTTLGGQRLGSINLTTTLVHALESNGYIVQQNKCGGYDIRVLIRPGFTRNLTNLKVRAVVEIERVLGVERAVDAENLIRAVVGWFSTVVSQARIEYLASKAGIEVNPAAVRDPVGTESRVVGPGGAPVQPGEDIRVWLARVMAFGLLFVTTPSIGYITDSVVGEKERRTLEALLVTPTGPRALIVGKAFATSIVGLAVSVGDAMGVLLFFGLPSLVRGVNILYYLTPAMLVTHVMAVYLSVLASLALILPVLVRVGSYRASQAVSLVVMSVASVIFFASLYADITKLPQPASSALLLLPYTAAVAMLKSVVMGDIASTIIYALLALGISVGLIVLSALIFDEEKAVYSKT
jgi:ABC-2 type transport system permease protein